MAWRRCREGEAIPTSLSTSSAFDSFSTGSVPGAGTFFCVECGSQLSLQENDHLPVCPRCGTSLFRRDSIFESMQEHGEPTAEFAIATEAAPPIWLREVRAELPAGGRYIACRSDDDDVRVFPIKPGWTRVGRSVAADVRLDDPSVSRRHALLVSEPGESLRILDDRSLNGVFVNGDLVEWGTVEDGDELRIGRYQLFAIES
jgi:hypothetical protein